MNKGKEKHTLDIDRLCKASHIKLTDAEKKTFRGEIEDILYFVEEALGDSELEGEFDTPKPCAKLREDECEQLYTRDEMLSSAPACEHGMPYVRRVIEGE